MRQQRDDTSTDILTQTPVNWWEAEVRYGDDEQCRGWQLCGVCARNVLATIAKHWPNAVNGDVFSITWWQIDTGGIDSSRLPLPPVPGSVVVLMTIDSYDYSDWWCRLTDLVACDRQLAEWLVGPGGGPIVVEQLTWLLMATTTAANTVLLAWWW